MTDIAGGLRDRLIFLSAYEMLLDALEQLGWFDATVSDGGDRQHLPITTRSVPVDDTSGEEIALNTLAVWIGDSTGEDVELGSNLQEMRHQLYVDFFAGDPIPANAEALGLHLIGDVRDILRGACPDAGRTAATLEVYDRTLTTPVPVFVCEIVDVEKDRVRGGSQSFQRHWFTVAAAIVDTPDLT